MTDLPTQHTTPHTTRRNIAIVLAGLWIAAPALLGVLLLTELGGVGDWLRARPDTGIYIFVAVFACTTGLGLLPPYAQAVLGGWVFGAVTGTSAVMCGLIGGATIGLLVARLVSGRAIISILDRNPRAKVIREALVESNQKHTMVLITLLRLPPSSPFASANLAMGAAGVRLLPLLGGTLVGMLPRTAALCTAAAAAAATGATDFQSLVAKQSWIWILAGIAGLLIAFSIIAVVARRALAKAGLGKVLTPQP